MSVTDEAEAVARWIHQLHGIATRILVELNAHEAKLGGNGRSTHRSAACFLLGRRGAELAMAAADDFHFNRPIAGAVVGRALLETALMLRWCLLTEENAERWWRHGDQQIQKSLRASGLSSDPKVVAIRGAKTLTDGLPGLPVIAKSVGLTRQYTHWYQTFSSYSHPTRMSLVHTFGAAGTERPAPLVLPCIYFATDVGLVCASWLSAGDVPEPHPHP